MDDLKSLIPVSYDNPERPTVSGRELHEFLQVDGNYTTWFKRMCEYGFTEGEDYVPILENRSDGLAGKPRTDHQLTIPMAGCNKQVIDLTYEYNWAQLKMPDGTIVEGKLNSWDDYEGDQLQVKIDGVTYLVHSSNIVMRH